MSNGMDIERVTWCWINGRIREQRRCVLFRGLQTWQPRSCLKGAQDPILHGNAAPVESGSREDVLERLQRGGSTGNHLAGGVYLGVDQASYPTGGTEDEALRMSSLAQDG